MDEGLSDALELSERLLLVISPILTCSVQLPCVLSHVRIFVSPWTAACQSPLSMGFSRQEYWSGSPLLSARNLSYPGIESESLASLALAGGFFTTLPPGKPMPTEMK